MAAVPPRTNQWMTLDGTKLIVSHPPSNTQLCTKRGCLQAFTGASWSDVKRNFKRHLLRVHGINVTDSRNVCRRCGVDLGPRTTGHVCSNLLNATTPFDHICANCGRGFTAKNGLTNHQRSCNPRLNQTLPPTPTRVHEPTNEVGGADEEEPPADYPTPQDRTPQNDEPSEGEDEDDFQSAAGSDEENERPVTPPRPRRRRQAITPRRPETPPIPTIPESPETRPGSLSQTVTEEYIEIGQTLDEWERDSSDTDGDDSTDASTEEITAPQIEPLAQEDDEDPLPPPEEPLGHDYPLKEFKEMFDGIFCSPIFDET